MTRQFPPHGVGGIGAYVEVLARMMAEAGHEVTVLAAAPGQGRTTELVSGVRVERAPAAGPRAGWELLSRASWAAASRLHAAATAALEVRRLADRFDVVEAPEWKAEGLLLGGSRRVPLVTHLHLPQELVRRWDHRSLRRLRGEAMAERLERRTVRTAAAVTATSRLSRRFPDGSDWLPDVPVDVVAPPLDLERWEGITTVESTEPVVLFLGHLERRKAPEVVVDALAQLRDEVDGVRGVFAGRSFEGADGRRSDDLLRARAEAAGVACEVLPPQRGDAAMRALYRRARVVVVPSRYETLSMVALEGFACGRPVVMSESVGATEWVRDAVPELVVPVDDPTALAGALRPLLQDPTEAGRLGRSGRAAVAATCRPDEVVAQRVAVYERVAS